MKGPSEFVEQLSAYLWTTHQVDAFRTAAMAYAERLQAAAPAEALSGSRLSIAVIGPGVTENSYPLFRKLLPYGVYFRRVRPENGLRLLLEEVVNPPSSTPRPMPTGISMEGRPSRMLR